ncbi:MAG: hypothetical protein KBT11_01125 [Treponema sp.]|nr:hypothetical protein [Candidatus Treponema equifaecale]
MIKAFSFFQTAFVLLIYVIPPLFAGETKGAGFVAVYPAAVFVNFVVGLALVFTGRKIFTDEVSGRFYWIGKEKTNFIAKNSWGLICFGGIIVVSVVFQIVGKFLGSDTIERIVFPDDFFCWIYFFS